MSDKNDRPTYPPHRRAPSGELIRSAGTSAELQRTADIVIERIVADARLALERAAAEHRDAVCADMLTMRGETYREGIAAGKRACRVIMRSYIELAKGGMPLALIDADALLAHVRASGFAAVRAEVAEMCRELGITVAALEDAG